MLRSSPREESSQRKRCVWPWLRFAALLPLLQVATCSSENLSAAVLTGVARYTVNTISGYTETIVFNLFRV